MKYIKPFANESDTYTIGGLTIENRLDRVSIYGDIDITKDKEGKSYAFHLEVLIKDIIFAFKAAGELPDKLPPSNEEIVKNPFS